MPQQAPLTSAEQDLIGYVARFAEQRGINGVCMYNGISASLRVPICFICAVGPQAEFLNNLIMKAQVEKPPIEIVSSLNIDDEVKRKF